MCRVCGEKPAYEGRVLCMGCILKAPERLTMRAVWKSRMSPSQAKRAEKEREQRHDRHVKRYLERKNAGLCVACGKPREREGALCVECRAKDRGRH